MKTLELVKPDVLVFLDQKDTKYIHYKFILLIHNCDNINRHKNRYDFNGWKIADYWFIPWLPIGHRLWPIATLVCVLLK